MAYIDDRNHLGTVIPLCLLIAGEVVVGYKTLKIPHTLSFIESLPNVVLAVLFYLAFMATPLFLIVRAVLKSAAPLTPVGCSWVCIFVGGFIQLAFHSSDDPSRQMLLGISFLVYWICGITTLVSFRKKQP